MDHVFDVAVIGGGINGCGCAADASLRKLSVVLFEKDDLASKTSSSSTKLIHGGLRYLEHLEFGLVKKALKERQILLDVAPHAVHPLPIVLPYQHAIRPAWLLRFGLFIYDHLSRINTLPKSATIHIKSNPDYFLPLLKSINKGILFYDASTDDARLTLFNALQAKIHGASIRPFSEVTHIKPKDNLWQLSIQPKTGAAYTVTTKSIINASGPWVNQVAKLTGSTSPVEITLVKGSHIIVPKMYKGTQAFLLQHIDKRIIFVLPYQNQTLIGTTEVPYHQLPDHVSIDQEEVNYLINAVNQWFHKKLSDKDVLFSWSGLRPLLSNKKSPLRAISRDYDYVFENNSAPVITIYGGKITTYRQLATEVVDQLKLIFPKLMGSTTKTTPLPGAHFKHMNFLEYQHHAKNKYNWLDPDLLQRYLHTYGTRMEIFLSNCTNIKSLGKKYGSTLYEVEINYLMQEEWAKSCDDILFRRTKLGLSGELIDQEALDEYLNLNSSRSTGVQ